VNHLYLPTKGAFKTKRKLKDLSQFWQNKNQYYLRGLLTAFPSPYCIRKKVPCTPRFKGTAKFINVPQELEKCN